jgi:type VI secretion system secreted protein Hcp
VIAFDWGVQSPRDAASGLATGRHQHRPFSFTTEIDRSHPAMLTALANNENIPVMEFQFWTPSPLGVEKQYLTYKFTNVHIVGVMDDMANNKHPDLTKFQISTQVSITYQHVEVIWVDGGLTYGDDWDTRA